MVQTCKKYILIVAIIVTTLSVLAQPGACSEDFSSWLEGLRQEARAKGISETTLHAALDNLQPIPRIIEAGIHPDILALPRRPGNGGPY